MSIQNDNGLLLAIYRNSKILLVRCGSCSVMESWPIIGTSEWYAEDGNPVGYLPALRRLYHDLKIFGNDLTKYHMIVRNDKVEIAREIFANQDIDLLNGHIVLLHCRQSK